MEQMLYDLFKAPQLSEAKCVLCVQPHSDDNEIGMGATIKKLSDMGCEIHYLTVTDGRLGTQDQSVNPDELAKNRREETKAAGAILGVSNFHFFDYKDGSLENARDLSYKISELIRTIKSDFVFVCDPYNKYEGHLDHVIVGQAVSQAVLGSSLAYYPENTTTKPFEVAAIGYYFTGIPNTYVEISDYIEAQFEAMAKHESQLPGEMLQLFKGYLLNQYKNYASEENHLAQGFKLLRPLHLHCITEAKNI